jgi:LmbE family N-acetylglucosaminyl deacetylase
MNVEMLKQMVPIPNILENNTYLFVGPHPDDIEVGAGGLVAKLIDNGKKVVFLIVTDGGSGSNNPNMNIELLIETRRKESSESSAFLGVKEIYYLDYPDGCEYSVDDVAKKITRIIIETNPDVILCPDPFMPSELHPDHVKTGNATTKALMMSNFPLIAKRNFITYDEDQEKHFRSRIIAFYYTNRVNQVIHLSQNQANKRMLAIQKHVSQFDSIESLQTIQFYLQIRGTSLMTESSFESSEGYFVLGPMHQHCFPEINFY